MISGQSQPIDITQDNLTQFQGQGAAFVTFGETMLRDTPADKQRPEASRLIDLSLGGSEYSIAVLLARLGIPSAYITRVPDNPYGWMLRDNARSHGVDVSQFVWAPAAEPMGRYIYELGRTPRAGYVWYQRMFSAASRLDAGMVDWSSILANCRLFHTSGISFGLAVHSGYEYNYLLRAFHEAVNHKPDNCLVSMDFNFRSTLWTQDECTAVIQPLIADYTDVLVTSIYDMARHFNISAGRYSAADINAGLVDELNDEDLLAFGEAVIKQFNLKVVAVTLRQSQSSEEHYWEAVAINADGEFFRTPQPYRIMLLDRLGGGDAWNGGFYYGLLTDGLGREGLEKGVHVGDAATAIKQTLMFDLPILGRNEINNLIQTGANTRTVR